LFALTRALVLPGAVIRVGRRRLAAVDQAAQVGEQDPVGEQLQRSARGAVAGGRTGGPG
jgi:hypothetical protein